MLLILNPRSDEYELKKLNRLLEEQGVSMSLYGECGKKYAVLFGDIRALEPESLKKVSAIEEIINEHSAFSEPVIRRAVRIGNRIIGGGSFQIIAGPCSVESGGQILSIAKSLNALGIGLLRGGTYKARTSPNSFQGLGSEGLALLSEAKRATGLATVSEITDIAHLNEYDDVDALQVGARNIQNYELLRALGKTNKPIILKRGFACTYKELLYSADYILDGGNQDVILCERGIRTFETGTRNTLDISAIPALKSMTGLPVIVDPSHGVGVREFIPPAALAAVAAGADGIMLEVHCDPASAMSDGRQSLGLADFADLAGRIAALYPHAYKYE